MGTPVDWTDSGRSEPPFIEDQAVKVVGEVREGQFRLGAGQTDGADEQPEPVLLVGEDMLDAGADSRFSGIGGR